MYPESLHVVKIVLELTLYVVSYFLGFFLFVFPVGFGSTLCYLWCYIDIDHVIVGFRVCKKGISLYLCT